MMAARPIKIRNREVTVRRAMPKGEDQRRTLENCKKIFLGSASGRPTATQGLDDSVEDKDLEEYFTSTCGKVVNVKQLRDPRTDKHKGVGFVEFDDHDAVDKAVLLHIHIIKDRELMVSKADDNESRQVRDREMRQMRDTREMRMNLDSMRGGMGGPGMGGPGMDMGGFGEEGWNRAKGHITYKESSMADYALKKKSHTIEGHLVTIAKAEPEPEPPGEEEEDLPEPEE